MVATKKRTPKKKKKDGVVLWVRSTGIGSFALGVGALVLSDYFTWAAGLIYFAVLLLMIDLYFEVGLSRIQKIAIGMGLAGFLVAFSLGVTFKPAPISLSAEGPKYDYADGTQVGGIKWKAAFTGIRVNISNQSTTTNSNDFVAMFQTDQPIAAIAQRSTIPNCFFQTLNQANPLITMNFSVTGMKDVDLQLLATTDIYVMRCQTVPAQTEAEVDIAVATVDNSQNLMERKLWGRSTTGSVLDVDLRRAGIGHYWFGNPDDNVYVRSPSPKLIRVWVDYRATYKPHHVFEEIKLTEPKGS